MAGKRENMKKNYSRHQERYRINKNEIPVRDNGVRNKVKLPDFELIPPRPPTTSDIWELQYCQLWGWNWVKKEKIKRRNRLFQCFSSSENDYDDYYTPEKCKFKSRTSQTTKKFYCRTCKTVHRCPFAPQIFCQVTPSSTATFPKKTASVATQTVEITTVSPKTACGKCGVELQYCHCVKIESATRSTQTLTSDHPKISKPKFETGLVNTTYTSNLNEFFQQSNYRNINMLDAICRRILNCSDPDPDCYLCKEVHNRAKSAKTEEIPQNKTDETKFSPEKVLQIKLNENLKQFKTYNNKQSDVTITTLDNTETMK